MSGSPVQAKTNIDGSIVPAAEAKISVLDRGFLYGDSVYEVFRTYDGVPLFMTEHFDRLDNSARLIQMTISQSREFLIDEIRRTIHATGACEGHDVYVRYLITRGEGPIDLLPDPEFPTRYVIVVTPLKPWPERHYKVGLTMAIPQVRRNPVDALDPNIKGGNYLNNVIAVMQAKELGAEESLILNNEDYVTEASNSNAWFVIDGEIVTPAAGNLRGLTKAALHQACRQAGVETIERDIHCNELSTATECFVTSATREVMPVSSLKISEEETVTFPDGGGSQTKRLQSLYGDFVRSHIETHAAEYMFAD